ncbi:MAG: hypothetical protein KGJ00_19155 [Bradyrhizobium sp.]|nr:hypothetical protein [Bradyrhizobium sp.]
MNNTLSDSLEVQRQHGRNFCRRGYDVMQQVKADSADWVKMGPGTLCGSLDQHGRSGIVTSANPRCAWKQSGRIFHHGPTPGYPALHVLEGLLLGMLGTYIAMRFYEAARDSSRV